jgi:putative membrane protein (TIGR04086 family)
VGVAIGLVVSLIITGVLASILAWLVLGGKISENSLGYFVMGTLVIASVVGSMLSASKIKRRWVLVCCITGTAYYSVLLLCTALLFGGQFQGFGVTAIMVLGGSITAGLLGLKKPSKQRSGYKKYRNR